MKGFAVLCGTIAIVLFAIGSVVGLYTGVALNVYGILWYAARVLVKFAAVMFVFLLCAWLAANSLGTSLGQMFASMREFKKGQENLSPVVVFGGILLAVAQIFGFAHATTFPVYVYDVLTKGGLGLLLGLGLTMVFARLARVHELGFAAFFHDERNNQIVILIMLAFNVALFVAMQS